MAGINRPQDKQIIDPATGRIKLEWDAYFARLESLLNLAGAGGVTSFEGRTGVVTAQSGDYTASEVTNVPAGNIAATTVQAALNELDGEKAATSHTHAASAIISGTFDDARIAESNVTQHEGAIDHDALSGFVANEHVDHTAVTLTAGAGLTGGGDISASRSFAVGAGTGITVNADDVAITAGGVGTTQLADEGVTLAKLEHAGAYTLLMRNAGTTGDPAYTKISGLTNAGAFGSGDKLVIEESSGELRKIDYDDLPSSGGGGGGGITLIASGSLPAAATFDITDIPANFAYLALELIGVSSDTGTRQPLVQYSSDNGSSFDATAANYKASIISVTSVSNLSVASLIQSTNQAAGGSWNARIMIFGYQGGPHALWSANVDVTGISSHMVHGCIHGNTATIDALRILWNGSGNFDAGTYALYGIS